MHDYVDTNTTGTSYVPACEYQVTRKKIINEPKTTTSMRSGSRPSREGTSLLFAAGTVTPMMMFPGGGQQ